MFGKGRKKDFNSLLHKIISFNITAAKSAKARWKREKEKGSERKESEKSRENLRICCLHANAIKFALLLPTGKQIAISATTRTFTLTTTTPTTKTIITIIAPLKIVQCCFI